MQNVSAERAAGPRRVLDTFLLRNYDELCRLAMHVLRQRRATPTVDAASALVHDVYIRLREQEPVAWVNQSHFMGWALRVMKWELADRGRQERAQKRGGGYHQVAWDEIVDTLMAEEEERDIAEALAKLRGAYPRRAAVVEHRVFGGYTLVDTAEQMGISLRTAEREWSKSKVYLRRVLEADAVAA